MLHDDNTGHNPDTPLTQKAMTTPAHSVTASTCSSGGSFPCAAIDQLRPSIAGLVGFAELLSLTELDDEQREYVNAIVTASRQLDGRLNALDAMGAMLSDRSDDTYVAPALCTVRGVLDQAIAAVAPHAEQRSIEIVANTTGDDQPILVDQDGLGLVLTNLVMNAVAYSNGRHVRVFAVRVKSERGVDTYRFAVSDDGGSLDPTMATQLFEDVPADDPDGAVTGSHDTCNGLPANQDWVTRHGGQIEVAVDPGTSTTFWFDLPVATAGA